MMTVTNQKNRVTWLPSGRFFIDKCEVTNAEYKAFVRATNRKELPPD